MAHQLGPDFLSDLPEGIIESILMFLPIRDAIRTSILSSKWRFRWTSLPRLVFHFVVTQASYAQHKIDEMRMKNFVTRTLFLHEGPIHKFKLDVSNMDSCPDTDQWLLFLSRKDIKELFLIIADCKSGFFHVPSCLYFCTNLTHLELEGCRFVQPPPNFKGFMCLRSLILRFVEAPSGTIESIIANSPLLENLECTYAGSSELRIRAPNLKSFSLWGGRKDIYLCAPLLDKMTATVEVVGDFLAEQLQLNHSVSKYTEFLGGLTNLESLIGEQFFTKYLSFGIEYCHHPLVFDRLKVVKLGVNFKDMDEMLVFLRLITDSPNLQELQIRCYTYEANVEKIPHEQFWDSACPQNCTFEKLKVVKITCFGGVLHEVKLIRFLLESSPVLETIFVEALRYPATPQEALESLKSFLVEPFQYPTTRQEVLDAVAELSKCCRASPSAKILLTDPFLRR